MKNNYETLVLLVTVEKQVFRVPIAGCQPLITIEGTIGKKQALLLGGRGERNATIDE